MTGHRRESLGGPLSEREKEERERRRMEAKAAGSFVSLSGRWELRDISSRPIPLGEVLLAGRALAPKSVGETLFFFL